MKILHTSDWHLGRCLYEKKRYDEFSEFLKWLVLFIANEKIDLLLISGDVFDTTAPSNRAQELYYHFLSKVSYTTCRNIVVIGGNHDSPTFLEAPKPLLGALNIHVVGAMTENPDDEIFLINDAHGKREAIVCAMPYLRDRDIRTSEAGESPADKNGKILTGIAEHYKLIASLARNLQDTDNPVPVIGMGHLFTREAITTDGDGIRELYIGSEAHVDGKNISEGFDYMALGHLHMAQKAGGSDFIRYSGSPLQMSFAEAGQKKHVVVVDFAEGIPVITEHPVPCYRELISVTGDIDAITGKINELKKCDSDAWLEIEITAQTTLKNLTLHFDDLLIDSKMEILRVKDRSIIERTLYRTADTETLETLDDNDVFTRCLDAGTIIDPGEREMLIATYREARENMQAEDINAV